jgi:hypothetical protein
VGLQLLEAFEEGKFPAFALVLAHESLVMVLFNDQQGMFAVIGQQLLGSKGYHIVVVINFLMFLSPEAGEETPSAFNRKLAHGPATLDR